MRGSQPRALRFRMWFEASAAILALGFGVITLFWRDWIEFVFRVDPDHHNGSAEWLVISSLFVIAIGLSALAARDWGHGARAPIPAV
jgi:hypothetical protein